MQWKQDVGIYTDDQRARLDLPQGLFGTFISPADMMAVHHFGKMPVRESVEPVRQFLSLIPFIGSGAEVIQFVGILLRLRAQKGVIMPVRDHANGPCGL